MSTYWFISVFLVAVTLLNTTSFNFQFSNDKAAMKLFWNFSRIIREELPSHSSICNIKYQMFICVETIHRLKKLFLRLGSLSQNMLEANEFGSVLCKCLGPLQVFWVLSDKCTQHLASPLAFPASPHLHAFWFLVCFHFLRPSNTHKSSLTNGASMQMKFGERVWQKPWLPYYYSLYTDPFRGPMWKQR